VPGAGPPDGSTWLHASQWGDDPEALGVAVAESLIAKGARELIDSIAPEAARTTGDLARRQRRRGLAWLALGGDKRPFSDAAVVG